MIIRLFLIVVMAMGTAVSAQDAPVRPLARGETPAAPLMRPALRPLDLLLTANGAIQRPLELEPDDPRLATLSIVRLSLIPPSRPATVLARAAEMRAALLRGQICDDPAIQGKVIGRVSGAGACGIDSAVQVKSVAGVRLSPQPKVDCRTAKAIKDWVEKGAKPAIGNEGGGIASLRTVSDYACRNRNSAASGRLSEHAFGRAIDIAGIKLSSGREITVLKGWGQKEDGARLRRMWKAACGPFGTVLGPNANRFHLDHFHFDTARYRSGSYCR